MSEKENSYIPHKRRLLKSFDKSIERGEQTLIDYYGIERASSLINEAPRVRNHYSSNSIYRSSKSFPFISSSGKPLSGNLYYIAKE